MAGERREGLVLPADDEIVICVHDAHIPPGRNLCKVCVMHRSAEAIAAAVLELAGFINDPRQDWRMMTEAGLDLDPVFLPLLVRLGAGPAGVVELAGQSGRDHSTMSRQLARLEAGRLPWSATPRRRMAASAPRASRRKGRGPSRPSPSPAAASSTAPWPSGQRATERHWAGSSGDSPRR